MNQEETEFAVVGKYQQSNCFEFATKKENLIEGIAHDSEEYEMRKNLYSHFENVFLSQHHRFSCIQAYEQIIQNLWDDRQYFKAYIDLLLENISEEEFEALVNEYERELVSQSSEEDQLVFACIMSAIPKTKIKPHDVADLTGWSLNSVMELEEKSSSSTKHLDLSDSRTDTFQLTKNDRTR